MNKINIPSTNLKRVVIIGGGFGGITIAEKLKRQPVQVVLIDKNNYHTFQPLLYQVATGGLEPDSIAFPLRKWFKNSDNMVYRMAEVAKIDPIHQEIITSIGELTYDFLIIATGSKTNFFGNTELENNSMGMKDIPESLNLRSKILQNFEKALLTQDLKKRESLMNFVIVGGGPTGVETAGALAELKRHILPKDYPELDIRRMQVHLIEANDQLLGGMSSKSSEGAEKELKRMGIHLWLNTRVEKYDGTKVLTQNGKSIFADTVIWSAGVVGASPNGMEGSLGKGKRFKVNHFNQIEEYENVFAIGDVATMSTPVYPEGHPMVAPVAIQQAELLSSNLMSLIYGRSLEKFVYKDKGSMATIGRNKAVVDMGKVSFKGVFAWLIWMGVHLFSLAGFRNRIVVFTNWFWSYVTYDKGTRLIIRPFHKKERTTPNPGKPKEQTPLTDQAEKVLV